LAGTITELAQTGRSALLERLRQRLPPGVLELRPVLNLKRMAAVHEALGERSLDDLRQSCESGRLRQVGGFGEKSERKILERSLDYRDEVLERFVRSSRRRAGLCNLPFRMNRHGSPATKRAMLGVLKPAHPNTTSLDKRAVAATTN
jgi:hypothetical protein